MAAKKGNFKKIFMVVWKKNPVYRLNNLAKIFITQKIYKMLLLTKGNFRKRAHIDFLNKKDYISDSLY